MRLFFTFLISLFFLCNLFAQKPRPVQIQTVDSSTFVVEYIPIEEAKKNVDAQLAQSEKQLQNIEKQIAELLKKRDQVMAQKSSLEYLKKQLDQATIMAPPAVKSPDKAPTPPATEKPAKKPKKKKN